MIRRIALLSALLAGAAACGNDTAAAPVPADPPSESTTTTATTSPPGQADDPAPQRGPLVDLAWLDDAGNDHVLVDVRSPIRYAEGHLPDAVNVPAESFNDPGSAITYQLGSADRAAEVLGAAGITPDDTVVFYDADAGLYATRAYFALTYYGHDDLRILDGGTAPWIEAGRDLTTEEPAITPTDYPAGQPRTDLRLELRDVTEALDAGLTTFADARAPAEYDGSLDLGNDREGHIPGARNVDYADTVGPDGRFLPVAELERIYGAAGIGPDSAVVTYCLVGARGAHSWFVLSELLGYPDVALYDGSWIEYGNTPETSVEA